MNTNDTYLNLLDRAIGTLDRLPELAPAQLNAHPAGHPNSVAWNLWHAGRVLDAMGAADLASQDQVWLDQDFRARFNVGELGDATGFGHTDEEAATIIVEDHQLLEDYIVASLKALRTYVESLDADAFDEVIGEFAGKPETRQDRLSLILIDAVQHIAQAQYVAGMTEVRA